MANRRKKYDVFVYDPKRKHYKVGEGFDLYRDFLYRNGLNVAILGEILGIKSDGSIRSHMQYGCWKLRDVVNINYFCTRQPLKIAELDGEAVYVHPTEEDKERIDDLWTRLKVFKEEK